MIRSASVAAVALLVGLALGFAAGRWSDGEAASESLPVKSVRPRTKRLESRFPIAPPRFAEGVAHPEPPKEAPSEPPPPSEPPATMTKWLADLQAQAPETYADTTNYWTKYRAARLERAKARLDFLKDVDTAGMGDTANRHLMELADATVEIMEVEDALWEGDNTPAEREALMEKVRTKDAQVNALAARSRNDLLRLLAHRLGLPREDTGTFVDTVRKVYDFTDPRADPIKFPF